MSFEVIVLGGCVLDIISSAKPLIPAASNPGIVSIQAGGVGRNISEALTKLGVQTLLVAPIGDDAAAETLKQQCKSCQMDVSGLLCFEGHRTAVYSALLDGDGELLYGVVDSAIFDTYHFNQLSFYYEKIQNAKLVVLDANASVDFMLAASTYCVQHNIPVFFEGTSVQKSTKLASAGSLLANLTWLCPNLRELIAIYYSTQTSHYLHHNEEKKESERGSEYQTEKRILESCKSLQEYLSKALETNDLAFYKRMIARLFEFGVRKWIVVKMGTKGALSAEKVPLDETRYEVRYTHFPIYQTTKLANVLGAGDNLVAGLIFGILRENLSVKDSVPYGLLAAKLCVESNFAVPRDLSADRLRSELTRLPNLVEMSP